MVSNFLEAYYHNTKPVGMCLGHWIWMVNRNSGWLRRMGDKRAVEPFIELLKDTVRFKEGLGAPGFKGDAFLSLIPMTLGELRDERAIPVLKECLKWKHWEFTRMEAAIALCFLGEAKIGLPVVEEYAKRDTPPFNPEGHGKDELVISFFTFGWEPVKLPKDNQLLVEYMERALKFPSSGLRVNAASWLIKWNKRRYSKKALEVASEILLNKMERSSTRELAIGTLKEIGDKPSKKILRMVVNDEIESVAKAAREALKELGEEK